MCVYIYILFHLLSHYDLLQDVECSSLCSIVGPCRLSVLHIVLLICCWEVASVVSDYVRPQRGQPTRLPCPRDSPGKSTGVGCHFLLQCMKVKTESEVAQSCPTLCDPMDCSPPCSSAHGIFQARVLEWGAIAFSSANPKCPILPPCPSPLATTGPSMSVRLFVFHRFTHLCHSLDSSCKWYLRHLSFSFRLTLVRMIISRRPYCCRRRFLRLRNVPSHACTPSLPLHLPMDTEVGCVSWLPWPLGCMHLFELWFSLMYAQEQDCWVLCCQ